MEKVIYNHDHLVESEVDEIVIRTKLLLINSKNELLLGCCHQIYQFPGGHLKLGETLLDCLKREILEETGIALTFFDAEPFFCICHYNKQYRGTEKNRCNKIYYYIIKTDEPYNLDKVNYDQWEIEGNYELRYVPLADIEQILSNSVKENGENKGIVEEMLTVITEYKKGGY